jgi:predicted DNA binding CopG/RHH family protein
MKGRGNKKRSKVSEIRDYDTQDSTQFINASKPMKLSELGVSLPEVPPTQVVSIRLPTELLNELRALGSQQDVPYQALIKLILNDGVNRKKKKKSA